MQVNRWDICIPGMEPWRGRDEFIISACVHNKMTREDILEALLLDVDCCERDADFAYDDCRSAIHNWFCLEQGGNDIMTAVSKLDYDDSNPDWAENCCCLFLYITE